MAEEEAEALERRGEMGGPDPSPEGEPLIMSLQRGAVYKPPVYCTVAL
jgi:hypothetical protein